MMLMMMLVVAVVRVRIVTLDMAMTPRVEAQFNLWRFESLEPECSMHAFA